MEAEKITRIEPTMHQVILDVSEELAGELKHHQNELQQILNLGLRQKRTRVMIF
ncbi:hypothetical protein H8E77_20920 [bacterium]|nr:hypothetical protein [bacterium]